MNKEIVFFDLETSGLDPVQNDVIQIAACAVDVSTRPWSIQDEFEIKVRFPMTRATDRALQINSYDEQLWRDEAVPVARAITAFSDFLKKHATTDLTSKRTGNTFKVAEMSGHNTAGCDMPFIRAMYGGAFFPGAMISWDTLQLAKWWSYLTGSNIENLRLGTLADHFGIDATGSHDALTDVRINVRVAELMLGALGPAITKE